MRSVLFLLVASTAALAQDPTPRADGFSLGSYGRFGVGTDLTGRLGHSANIVAHGPRLLESGYAELEVRRDDDLGAVKSRVVTTLAFFPPFFQFDGNAAQSIALRNLYAEGALGDSFSAWVGSRMVRGDDIYLLDFWPLDNLNTVGGGARYTFESGTRLELTVGLTRLAQPSQLQFVLSPSPVGSGAVPVASLDRPRLVESLKLVQDFPDGARGLRFSLYAEAHQLSAGVWRDPGTGDERALPVDSGYLVGGQATGWLGSGRFLHLWVREAVGLATVDPLSLPTSTANDFTTQGAHSTRVAMAAGFDGARFGVLAGGYVDLVRAAGVASTNANSFDEGALVVRGQWYAAERFGVAAELSHQRRTVDLVDAASGALRTGSVTQLGLMPYFSPLGQGLFARPQLRVVYAVSFRDAGARSFFAPDDVFSRRGVEHYLGLSVEWWFNSSSYGGR